MRRSQLLVLVTAASLAGFVILLATLTAAPVTASPAELPVAGPMEGVSRQHVVEERLLIFIPPSGLATTSTAIPSHNNGAGANIDLGKYTNGQDADVAPGIYVLENLSITWTYRLTNTGNISLTDVVIWDDYGTPDDNNDDVLVCDIALLEPDQSSAPCDWTGTAGEGQYSNLATAYATPLGGLDVISATDASHYYGAVTTIDLEKHTNGQDADEAPGPIILNGDPLTWTVTVTNTGNVTLSNILVSDDILTGLACDGDELGPDEWLTCEAAGTAGEGQHTNLATVLATPIGGLDVVSDTDRSYYFGAVAEMIPEKYTNGQDADKAPGSYVLVNDSITWTYRITNTGNITLAGVVVWDDYGTPDDNNDDVLVCDIALLEPDQSSAPCDWTGTAGEGQYSNVATAYATPLGGLNVISATDASHYYGAVTTIDLEKHTNGQDADSAPGPYIMKGDTITWTFTVTNTGNITLSDILVSDDILTGLDCAGDVLGPDEWFTCEETGTAGEGQHTNLATALATPLGGLAVVSDTDRSYYFGAVANTDLEKYTNGQDADNAPGPYIVKGDPITWTFIVTNTGNITLSDILVSDDILTGLVCDGDVLGPDEWLTCEATGTAGEGQHTNLATALATPLGGLAVVSDTDHSYYFGAVANIDLEKYTNGQDADNAPGPYIVKGDPITWTLIVTNTGNITLSDILVSDDILTGLVCDGDVLGPDEWLTCEATGTAGEGQHTNLAMAAGTPPGGLALVIDTDRSYYFGAVANIDLEKYTNGQDADEIPGPVIHVGDLVSWTYRVTNNSNVTVTDIQVTDSMVNGISCPRNELTTAGDWMECDATGTAQEGQYSNLGLVTALPPGGMEAISDTDPSHYFGDVVDIGFVEGTVMLQSRSDHTGAEVCAWFGGLAVECTTTDAAGSFELAVSGGTHTVTVGSERFLDGLKTGVSVPATGTIVLPPVMLLGGDCIEDCTVNIQDLAFMGARYLQSCGDPNWDNRADINNDCTVNILDIAVTGGNYQKSCPVSWPESKRLPIKGGSLGSGLTTRAAFSLFKPTWLVSGNPP